MLGVISCRAWRSAINHCRLPAASKNSFFLPRQYSDSDNNHYFSSRKLPHCIRHRQWKLRASQSPYSASSEVSSDALEQALGEEEEVLLSEEDFSSLPIGIPKGFFVVKQYTFSAEKDFDWSQLGIDPKDAERLDLSPRNVSLPIALMMADPIDFPSFSRARKACRKGNVLIHRGALKMDEKTPESTIFDPLMCVRGRVGDRLYPGDTVGKQVRIGSGYFPVLNYKKPPFELPVIIEDDHWALVNKPAGIVVYNQRNGGHGIMTVRAALPFVLAPPKVGTISVLRRPASVHRLDKPTSGILCIAKTKPAMLCLSRQFHDRIVKKTYFAVINGIPTYSNESKISSKTAYELGVDVDPNDLDDWQLIDSPLDEKKAVTVWRVVRSIKSLHANDGYLTLVELKPKTGRYHQLRRHMAWVCQRPLVGDDEYDGGTESAMRFRDRGLFLCSTRVSLEHPYYNSPEGRLKWDELVDKSGQLWLSSSNKVMVTASITLPVKFSSLLRREEERFAKFHDNKI